MLLDHPEYLALLRGVLENPQDVAVRLILSDWLEENGRESAAKFIRSQIYQDFPKTVPLSWIDPVIERIIGVQPHQMSNSGCKVDAIIAATGKSTTLVIYKRGFAEEVRLTCAEFMGGTCEACQGSGSKGFRRSGYSDDFVANSCPTCRGTGRIEGVARALFERHPLTKVVLTDARPDFHMTTDIDYFNWFGQVVPQGRLPQALIGLLPNRGYERREDAFDALSDACVSYARSLAGLPPL
jgi:uncharacterized protein (TIGR02996 family)